MSPTLKLVAGLIVAGALVGGAIALRRYVAVSQPPPLAVAERPTPRRVFASTPSHQEDHGDESEGFDAERGEAPLAGQATIPTAARLEATKKPEEKAATAETPSSTVRPHTRPSPKGDGPAYALRFDGTGPPADQPAPLIEQGLQLDAHDGSTLFPPDAVLALPDSGGAQSDQGTIGMWVRRETDPTDGKGRGLIELVTGTWENRLEVGFGPTTLRFLMTTSDGSENAVNAGIAWAQGDWHHVAVTWGDALMMLYVDGMVQDQRTYTGTLEMPPGTPLYLASSRRGPSPDVAPISVRGFTVLQQSASANDIATLMSETAPSR
ncbi:MAG TPA: LamG-like jellyroll fold domain-containing protein [Candidatus Binatia bacterium]|nr:LamG-like jellyroll fold domain-containing protein [Candidatus Binatia bacterium]